MAEVSHTDLGIDESRAEVDTILTSASFARSPRAARLLHYLCSKYFAGEAADIKEYNIALDVLGRPDTFDPAQDAGVRVEVHRLRKKLREYYERDGSDHPVRVCIPTGSYIPVFGRPELLSAAPAPAQPLQVQVSPPVPSKRTWSVSTSLALLGVAATLVFLGAWLHWRPTIKAESKAGIMANSSRRDYVQVAPAGPPPGVSVRILAGRTRPSDDRYGNAWSADRYFTGGQSFERPVAQLGRTRDPLIYSAGRVGDFSYDIPLPAGTYELRLYFAETEYGPAFPKGGGENNRTFHVNLNSKRILNDFDIVADADGSGIADLRVFKDVKPGPDGQVHLSFISIRDKALVNAIELTPSRPGRLNPLRFTARSTPLRDSRGAIWLPDDMVLGGQSTPHPNTVREAPVPGMFDVERYGHFTYAIAVGEGTYDVSLYLAETFWGPESAGGGGTGSRVFNILCNGAAIARNLDIYKEVGGNRALVLRFPGVQPNPQGKLLFDFEPIKNYASIYGIEVLDSTP